MFRGIQYLIDEEGRKMAVVIDLESYGTLWEDFCDTMLAEQRRHEPRITFGQLKRRLRGKRRLPPNA